MAEDTFGGVVALRFGEGLKWHRLVDFATAEAYARRHGRTRLRRDDPTGRSLTACGVRGRTGAAAEQRVFEDRPGDGECGKCWS